MGLGWANEAYDLSGLGARRIVDGKAVSYASQAKSDSACAHASSLAIEDKRKGKGKLDSRDAGPPHTTKNPAASTGYYSRSARVSSLFF